MGIPIILVPHKEIGPDIRRPQLSDWREKTGDLSPIVCAQRDEDRRARSEAFKNMTLAQENKWWRKNRPEWVGFFEGRTMGLGDEIVDWEVIYGTDWDWETY